MTADAATTGPPLAREGLVSLTPPALLGGSCSACGALSFPRERFCPACGAPDPQEVALATRGTIYSYTIVRFAPPGYAGPVPYGLGVVDLDDGIRVTTTLVAEPLDALRVGAEAGFRLLEVATDDGPVTAFAYEQDAG